MANAPEVKLSHPIVTRGRVAHGEILGQRVRIIAKPSLGKTIPRKAGVVRESAKVVAVNKAMAEIKPASACKGKKFRDGSMQACLREQLKDIKAKAAAKLREVTGG
jgi:hypothetical protein